ncbi:hypothetical protein B5F82_05260 [Megamonas hypermegale]|uniref:YceD family protein n=1 Tax=Megamonas hypermegale TaxID=158847 RepID=UPI000B38737A|nr:DUF177 domain-containing protein [Megamonas hypermegale]MBM6760288.1 DUF177 domain-containing protein [Megamonas hypermegale]MBM6832941.1 DUF177 domain-containing protein [Megamonas hypermegale]OUO40061.1 hypothetical protein B5F82_05260 [Megamonas hypermegale]HJG07299.1 DUF177 domain-containing protein [Megamonas hypermegale]
MMKINVSEIAERIGHEMAFSFDAKPEDIGQLIDDCELTGPIMVKGTAVNTGMCFRIEGNITCLVACICDRCLERYQVEGNYPFAEEFTRDENLAKTEDMNCFDGDIIDIGDLVRDIIISAQPTKHLCSEDCKGLCSVCGANLNKTECGCNRESIDPRLAALQELLQKNR